MNFLSVDKVAKSQSHTMNVFHSHSHYEFYILTKGERTVFFYNTLYTIKAPACIIIPPFIMHKTEGGGYERFNINILPKYLDATEKTLLSKRALAPLTFSEKDQKTILRLLDFLLEFQEKDEEFSDYMMRSFFNCILAFIARNTTQPPDAPSSTKLPPILLKMMDYFNTHYKEKISLDLLAEKFYISKTTVIYNFKKHLNVSPIDYLLNIRLEKAKEFLLTPQKMSIEQISEQCGFSSANYFTECFKSREGVPPTEFRKFNFQET
ncbi:MAG: helix-turn-helix domain-containing protein [Clostridia bacterium]|nr:helix-turn-helix domain-containing protein [Clostridia bacterium]